MLRPEVPELMLRLELAGVELPTTEGIWLTKSATFAGALAFMSWILNTVSGVGAL